MSSQGSARSQKEAAVVTLRNNGNAAILYSMQSYALVNKDRTFTMIN